MRRSIIRPAPISASDIQRQQRMQRLRSCLDKERTALTRWMARLKRSFHAVEKEQRKVAHLERQLARLEE
jgi:uncharacterized protein involved in exopolysaccharide biosynthesis